ncbi:cystathionine beta-lyase [Sesbania bispinosa]|nr:cystathionine beta-lyase [Sesbania bispinosa]
MRRPGLRATYGGCCGIGTMGKDTSAPLRCCLVAATVGLHGDDGGGANLRQRRERLEARGNGGLRRAFAFGGTVEGERNLGRPIEQRRTRRLRPWLHEGIGEERETSAMATRQSSKAARCLVYS